MQQEKRGESQEGFPAYRWGKNLVKHPDEIHKTGSGKTASSRGKRQLFPSLLIRKKEKRRTEKAEDRQAEDTPKNT